ncbi:hypothetical protein ACODM8_09625 [Vibrio ostreicida]|uniref:hypothetical protein n=1 Tax=Vibrio ostreicida TaxID=526588 RepID=UPI003B5B03F6
MMIRIILLVFLIFSFSSYAEVSVSDCNLIVENIEMEKAIEKAQLCVEEAQKQNSEINQLNQKFFNDVESETRSTYQSAISIFGMFLGLFIAIKILMTAYQFKTKSNSKETLKENVIAIVASSFILTVLVEQEQMKNAITTIGRMIYASMVTPLALLNTSLIDTDNVNFEVIKGNQTEIRAKAKEIRNHLIESELCALEQRQKSLSFYEFDEAVAYDTNKELTCFDDKLTDSFESGRSPLNQSILTCSINDSEIYADCGKLYLPENSDQVKQTISNYSARLNEWLNKMDGYVCNELTNQYTQEKTQSFCKEFNKNTSVFEMKTNESKISKLLTEQEVGFELFIEDLESSISKDLDVTGLNEAVDLLNVLDQIFSLFTSNSNIESINIALKNYIQSIYFTDPSVFNLLTKNYREELDSKPNQIDNVNDYFNYTKSFTLDLLKEDRSLKDIVLDQYNFLKDPKLLVGSYASESTSEGYNLHTNVLRSIRSVSIDLVKVGAGLKISAKISETILPSVVSKLISTLGSALMVVGSFAVLSMILLIIKVLFDFMLILERFIMLLINIIIMLITKKRLDNIINDFLIMMMIGFRTIISISFTLIASTFFIFVMIMIFDSLLSTNSSILYNIFMNCAFVFVSFVTIIKIYISVSKITSEKLNIQEREFNSSKTLSNISKVVG